MILTWVSRSSPSAYNADCMAQLFFLDYGPSEMGDRSLPIVEAPGDGAIQTIANAPVWEDSDEERMMVSLASNPRLRKLRLTESENLVNGKVYTERLRKQYVTG